MLNFNSTSSILIVISILTFGVLYFIGLAFPDRHEIVRFGFDTAFLVLVIGYILRKKNIQQLIGLFLYTIVYNFGILKGDLFQIQNDNILQFLRLNTFYILVLSFALLFPTLFENYRLTPLTNNTNIEDTTIILSAIILTVLIQTTVRLTV